MFEVKICGVRLKSDVQAVGAAGSHAGKAVAIGLNFYPASARYVDPESAETAELSATAARAGILRVGVFVHETPEKIARIAAQVGLAAVQLHGDETVEEVDQLFELIEIDIIRAIKLPTGPISIEEIDEACQPWLEMGCGLLFDADAGSDHGGSGKTLDWPSIRSWADANPDIPWMLAGGLTPENVAEAIEVTGAKCVDTASGVEESRGVKSAAKIEEFIQAI
ncbi:N-(5'-phosphoribosyl)anthranilate isomerase [Rubripirellula obstinata]|uniref:N-(5'-phosphoribosyl)anthranilate isomerase n=1 Tax=Rubripirellula obstinata TaxID=406547 RepID=A0A5B1CC48_9BACT|nr:phosphoribosylanthranilate isomerase [Rubripirellula obstinata]KAA1257595.1 N-(5'-phosphoribosyl)anthranilate isomerase [Rubripirellula obstinata]